MDEDQSQQANDSQILSISYDEMRKTNNQSQ